MLRFRGIHAYFKKEPVRLSLPYTYEELRSVALDVLSGRENTRNTPDSYDALVVAMAEVLQRRGDTTIQQHNGKHSKTMSCF